MPHNNPRLQYSAWRLHREWQQQPVQHRRSSTPRRLLQQQQQHVELERPAMQVQEECSGGSKLWYLRPPVAGDAERGGGATSTGAKGAFLFGTYHFDHAIAWCARRR